MSEFSSRDVGAFSRQEPERAREPGGAVSSEIVRAVREGAADFGVCWMRGNWADS